MTTKNQPSNSNDEILTINIHWIYGVQVTRQELNNYLASFPNTPYNIIK